MIVLIPQITINFASMKPSGRRMMFKKAKVSAEDVIHLTENTTFMHGFYSKKGAPRRDLGYAALAENFYVPGQFAVN
ncbi:MAG: hypothetical protein ACN4GF_01785 [Lentimonas sp.]